MVVWSLLMLSFAFAGVYEIAEPDLLEELEAQKGRIISHLERMKSELKERIESFEGEKLFPAAENRTYYIDPTYCLEENIYYREKGKWKVLYPKGYCFNPIDYIPYEPPPMVVFNPCREEERRWVKKNYPEAVYVSTGCPIRNVRKLGVKTYFLTPELKEKLRLTETVSVVRISREKGLIEVEVVRVGAGGNKGGASGKAEGKAN
ncbi:MAG TPA: hypothetical protein ENJ61_00315 [Aquifex aeolicus]|uniref:Uncharacterized protein n=1 Tax=Aquifex aeolicus TaxID=63363 RepID=A0A7C5L251_AQUAO|nr:hypothetical protein [Aquifex aeolicus]